MMTQRVLIKILFSLALTVGLIGLGWRYGPQILTLTRNQEALQAYVEQLGWAGPFFLVCLNALQILIAPIPGYAPQIASGFLFGPLWGGIWGTVGLLIGSFLAMWLTRIYGRPLAERMVGARRLAKWEGRVRSDNTLLWAIILFAPTGDLPYFLAGLIHISYFKILLLVVITRVPTTFVVAAAGSGVIWFTWWQLLLLFALLMILFLLLHRYQDQLQGWLDGWTHRFLKDKPYV